MGPPFGSRNAIPEIRGRSEDRIPRSGSSRASRFSRAGGRIAFNLRTLVRDFILL